MGNNRGQFFKNFLLFSFGVFGFSALIFQVVFARNLVLLFGLTAPAIATVLAVYFSGLAIGGLVFGKIADNLSEAKNLKLYSLLFITTAVYGFLFPFLFKLLNLLILAVNKIYPLIFSGFNFFAFALSFIFLVFPAVLIGAGFPVLNKILIRQEGEIGKKVSFVYFIETFGSVLGAVFAGFWLIPAFGNNATIFIASGLSAIVGGLLFAFFAKLAKGDEKGNRMAEEKETETEKGKIENPIFLYALFITGFLALALEVFYTKTLILFIGSSTYAFSLILITFLLGIALGSWTLSFFVDKIQRGYAYFGIFLGLIGFWLFLTLKIFNRLPFWYLDIFKYFESFEFQAIAASQFLLTFLVIFPATFLMGAVFVMAIKFTGPSLEKLGGSIGKLYFTNTAGGVLGSLAGGFLFLPILGYQKTLMLIMIAYFCMSVFFIFKERTLDLAIKIIFAVFLIFFAAFAVYSQFFSPWSQKYLTLGVFPYADTYIDFTEYEKSFDEVLKEDEVLFYQEGLSNISVIKRGKDTLLRINGKTDASNSSNDMEAEILIGALPMLFHPEPKDVLVIGLGSGITLGTIAQFDSAEAIDVVEVDPAIIKAADYFKKYNHDALTDPRVRTIAADGRNHLLFKDKKYDVISSEPSNLWVSGNAYLFTKEFYELAKTRLNNDGIMLQWLHLYSLEPSDIKAVLKTFQEVFPQVYLFDSVSGGDMFLVGSPSDKPILDFNILQNKFQSEKIQNELARILIYNPYDILVYLAAAGDQITNYSQNAETHFDNRPFLEFSSPKAIYKNTTAAMLDDLHSLRKDLNPLDVILGADAKELLRSFQFAKDLMPVKAAFAKDNLFEGLNLYKKAISGGNANLLMESYIWSTCSSYAKLIRLTKGEDIASATLERCSEAFEVAVTE